MAELKTKQTDASARDFVAAIPDPARRRDCMDLLRVMEEIAGEPPRMWGSSIVGFGTYDYRYASGRTGTWFRAGFSPRKQALTLYLMLDLDACAERLDALGKHKRGKSCVYVRGLADIDLEVLKGLVRDSCDQASPKSCGGSR